MDVKVLAEAGYEESALGFSLSYNSTTERAKELFPKFAFKQGGENKFLESIVIWLDVRAPRFWWQEADTYRVGTTKQSESTMHTLKKAPLMSTDFEHGLYFEVIDYLNRAIRNEVPLEVLKNMLPEGFLQRRIWMMSYKTMQNIYNQRINHKLPQWQYFLHDVMAQLEHPEFIVKEDKNGE